MSLHLHPTAQREDRRQVRAGPPASQVPSQAPRFIFLSSPPTASSLPPISLTSQAPQASPRPGRLNASQDKASQAHLTDEKTGILAEDMTCPKG